MEMGTFTQGGESQGPWELQRSGHQPKAETGPTPGPYSRAQTSRDWGTFIWKWGHSPKAENPKGRGSYRDGDIHPKRRMSPAENVPASPLLERSILVQAVVERLQADP